MEGRKVKGLKISSVVVDDILKMDGVQTGRFKALYESKSNFPKLHEQWEKWMSEWFRHAASAESLVEKSRAAAEACRAVHAGTLSTEEGRRLREEAVEAWHLCAKLWR